MGNVHSRDRVCDLTIIGSYSEYICVFEDHLVPVPDSIDPGEAVSLVLTYVTAYQMLHRVAKVETGQSILVHGAVGTALLELPRLKNLNFFFVLPLLKT